MERQTVNAVLAYNGEAFDLPQSIKKIESSLSSCQLALWLIPIRDISLRTPMRNHHDRSPGTGIACVVRRSNCNRVMTSVQVRASTRCL